MHGLLVPLEFIDLVDASTLALRFASYALRTALTEYRRSGLPGQCIVNVPAALLADPGLLPVVEDALADAGPGTAALTLEVMEHDLVPVVHHVVETATALRAAEVRLAVDGFGVGAASLDYLERLPVGEVKIGRRVIAGIDVDPARQRAVAAMVEVAGLRDTAVVAVGVETPAEVETCYRLGVRGLQGYALGAPALLADWSDRFVSGGDG